MRRANVDFLRHCKPWIGSEYQRVMDSRIMRAGSLIVATNECLNAFRPRTSAGDFREKYAMNYQILTEALKYLGLLIGTASSVWGALNELKEDGPDGRKKLTRAGKLSIVITIFSFAVSLTSQGIGDNLQRKAEIKLEAQRQDERIAELARHQELISHQVQTLSLEEKTREEALQRFDRLAHQEAASTADILIAGQSLRDISLTWQFPKIFLDCGESVPEIG